MSTKIIFNNINIPDFVKIININTQILPDLDIDIQKGIGEYKTYINSMAGKKITMDYKIKATGLVTSEKINIFAKWLKGENFGVGKLILPNMAQEYYIAQVVNSVEIKSQIRAGVGTIEFILINPYRIFEGLEFSGSGNLQYYGDGESKPILVISILQQCEEIKLNFNNVKYKNFIRLQGVFNKGQIITINIKNKCITLDNKVTMSLLTLDSDFHTLITGDNIYSFNENLMTLKVIYNKYVF